MQHAKTSQTISGVSKSAYFVWLALKPKYRFSALATNMPTVVKKTQNWAMQSKIEPAEH